MKSLIYKLLFVAMCLVVSTPAFAFPTVDGNIQVGEYANSFQAGWYNGHHQDNSQYLKTGSHMTTVYWEDHGGYLYLGLSAPLKVKNMIWGTGVTNQEAVLYYQHYSGHHSETLAQWIASKSDYEGMTKSEKVLFGSGDFKIKDGGQVYDKLTGVKYDLAGNATVEKDYLGLILRDSKDSEDYVTEAVVNGGLGQDTTNSNANTTPMAFEFKFDSLSSTDRGYLFSDIQTNEIEFHLSPERGGIAASAVPEPGLGLLLVISLIGLVGVGAVQRIRQKAVVKVKS